LGWTDEQGAFQCFLVEPRPGTLLIQHQACSTTFLHDYAVPTSGREVEFRLQPARRVTIEVVDATGRPVPQAEVWIRQEGFIQNTHRIEANRHIASSLTERPFQIEVRLAGRKYVKEHSPDVPEARVLVPVHGSVMASVSGSTTRARAGRLSLVLEPTEGDGDALVEGRDVLSGELSIEISAVLPGRYDEYLLHTPTDDERAAGREEQRSASVSVTVKAEQRTELRLDID